MELGQVYNTYNPEILKLIVNPKNVLDVGCGTGLLAQEIKKRCRCFVTGVEKDPQAASIASKRCDKVIEQDLEDMDLIPLPVEAFDYIVLADVLEHTTEPARILGNIKRYLSKEGSLLISVPNIAHWRMRLKLMFGRFDYKERGVLDKTHLRFFNLRAFQELLESRGLEVVSLSGHGNFLANIFKGLFASFFVAKTRLSSE